MERLKSIFEVILRQKHKILKKKGQKLLFFGGEKFLKIVFRRQQAFLYNLKNV